MSMLPRILLLLMSFAYVGGSYAQVTGKAQRNYRAAIRLKANKKPAKAFKKLEKAVRKAPTWADPYSPLGQWYFQTHQFAMAAEVFRNAAMRTAGGKKQFARPYAQCLLYAGRAQEALQVIGTWPAVASDSEELVRLREQALFILQYKARMNAPWPANLGPRVNTQYPELFPSMAVDTQTLYFTRRVNNIDDDLYRAAYDSCGGWLQARDMGYLPNTSDQENSLFISADGHYSFFTRCGNRSLDGWSEGECDIFMSYRVANDSPWTIAQPFGSTINTPAFEGMPSLSPDNRELYFVSDREGGYGGYDIWVSVFDDGLWQLPTNAGPGVNSPGNETAPYINVDNKTLYFTSDWWPGLGGTDLYMSTKAADGTLGKALNLGYPINTAHDEKSACVTMDGSKLYFATDRQGPAGNYDLMEVPLPDHLRPVPVSYITGFVYDSISRERLVYSSIYVKDARTGEQIYKVQSNRGDASYLITLHLGTTYALHTEHIGYTSVDDTIVFDRQYLQQPLRHNVPMLVVGYKEYKPIKDSVVAIVHFDVNRVELTQEDKDAIREGILPWIEETDVQILVNGYTDNTGTPMINEGLSHKRAKLVADYLKKLGVYEMAIEARGWGEAKMIASNETEEGQRQNRRVEITIKR